MGGTRLAPPTWGAAQHCLVWFCMVERLCNTRHSSRPWQVRKGTRRGLQPHPHGGVWENPTAFATDGARRPRSSPRRAAQAQAHVQAAHVWDCLSMGQGERNVVGCAMARILLRVGVFAHTLVYPKAWLFEPFFFPLRGVALPSLWTALTPASAGCQAG